MQHTESPMEAHFIAAWERLVPHIRLETQYWVGTGPYRLDFAHPTTKTAIEIDGYEHHSDRERFTSDRQRDRALQRAGWQVLHFSGSEITHDVDRCVWEAYDVIRDALQKLPEDTSFDVPEQDNLSPLVSNRAPDVADMLPTQNKVRVSDLFERACAHYERGDWQAAIDDFTTIINTDPHYAPAYNNRGAIHYELGNVAAAIADYSAAIRNDPHSMAAIAYENRGHAHYGLGELAAAITDYSAAIEINPGYADLYAYRGLAHYGLGNLAAAIADYEHFLSLHPDAPDRWGMEDIIQALHWWIQSE